MEITLTDTKKQTLKAYFKLSNCQIDHPKTF